MCFYGDGPEVSWTRTPKARKGHTCCECGRAIEVGEQYEAVSGRWDGDWDSFTTCRHCVAARQWLVKVCNGWVHHDLWGELVEHRHEGYNPRWLSVAIAGMDKKWRKPDGTLWRPLKLPKNLPTGVTQ